MKTLLVMRHAKSSWQNTGVPDHDRPLKLRGKVDAPQMGRFLRDQGLTPQLIISSTAKRARKTAKLVAQACGYESGIELEDELYNAGPTSYIRVLQGIDDQYHQVMVVGHNPGLELLLEVLTGAPARMPTAALARLELPIDSWAEVREYVGGTLVDLWTPKTLRNGSG